MSRDGSEDLAMNRTRQLLIGAVSAFGIAAFPLDIDSWRTGSLELSAAFAKDKGDSDKSAKGDKGSTAEKGKSSEGGSTGKGDPGKQDKSSGASKDSGKQGKSGDTGSTGKGDAGTRDKSSGASKDSGGQPSGAGGGSKTVCAKG